MPPEARLRMACPAGAVGRPRHASRDRTLRREMGGGRVVGPAPRPRADGLMRGAGRSPGAHGRRGPAPWTRAGRSWKRASPASALGAPRISASKPRRRPACRPGKPSRAHGPAGRVCPGVWHGAAPELTGIGHAGHLRPTGGVPHGALPRRFRSSLASAPRSLTLAAVRVGLPSDRLWPRESLRPPAHEAGCNRARGRRADPGGVPGIKRLHAPGAGPPAVGRGDHCRVAAYRRAPTSPLISAGRPCDPGRRTQGPWNPGRPARQPGRRHTGMLKASPRNTAQHRPAPAINPDERSGLGPPHDQPTD
jgi:hypothetical protein